MPDRVVRKQIFAAVAALALGIAVYLFDRTAGAYFLPKTFSASNLLPPFFGGLGLHIPSFVHTYAFILLTTACLPARRSTTAMACAAWFLIECLFELAQHPVPASIIGARLPQWFQGVPCLEAAEDYFRIGRFDPLDLAAIALGTGLAWLTITMTHRRRRHEIPAS